ncbi:MAG: hypothetical protein AAGC64_11020 [Bacteroidota bacterium]
MRITIKLLELLLMLSVLLITTLLVSCEKPLDNPFKQFVIPENRHSPLLPRVQSLQSHTLEFETIFDESAIYQTKQTINQHDINKLYGFSDCNSSHKKNSARFGWRWLKGKLEIHAYVYSDGNLQSEYVGEIELNQSYFYQIELKDKYYVFSLEGFDLVFMERSRRCKRGLYYMLFPYFGGDEVAPHDILIQIRRHSF